MFENFYITSKKLKICIETQKTLKSHTVLRKKDGTGRIMLPDFWQYYEATVV